MAIHVIQSQSIEVLVQGGVKSTHVVSNDPFSVLKPQHFIVPSPAIEEWLSQKMAEQQGMSANTIFHQRIRGFQWFAYQQVLEDKDKVRKANIPRLIMKWRIYQTLKGFIVAEDNTLAEDHPLFGIIQRIYDAAAQLDHGLEKQLKKQSMLYWTAEQVSKLFSNYMQYRGDCQRGCGELCHCPSNWLGQWGRGQELDLEQQFFKTQQQVSAFTLNQAQELEHWQRWLWQHTFHEDFVEMQGIDADFWQVMDDPAKRPQALKKLPDQLIVFTLLDLPPSQLQFLRRLGQYVDVVILHYNPSQEYWADSVDPNWKKQYDLRVKERFIAKYPKATDADIQKFFDEFTLNFNAEIRESRHPLLTRFGKQARDHFSILSNLSSGEEGQWIDAFVDEEPKNLLTKLQSDILYLVEPEPHAYPIAKEDDSIQIHVCHSALRQLEVLKDQLIHWLAQGTADNPHRPSDILVLAPDLKQIEPLVRSIFPHIPNQDSVYLPVKIAGVTQLDAVNAWRAVLGRIQLVQGRFSVEDFADWLSLNATQLRYGLDISNTERMVALLINAGFKRGLDAVHLQRTLSADDTDYRFSFKYALDRLALGVAIPEHTIFSHPQGDTLSYAQVLPSDFELIATLIEIYQDFAARREWMIAHETSTLSQQKIHVESWLKRLMQDIVEFEQCGVEALKSVREIVKKQERMLTLANYYDQRNAPQHDAQDIAVLRNIDLPLPYLLHEIQNVLEGQFDQALPTGQVTFSQIGQIRPLPYKLIVMLNLDSGKFPNRNTHLPFDLMEILKPQLGDRSRLDDDQGAFLDALLLAQENLWLFYNGFDVSDGEVRDPSSVLQELINHIALIAQSPDDMRHDPSDKPSLERADRMIEKEGIEIPEQIQSLYHVHRLQPFDPSGFTSTDQLRYQDQWFAVAQKIQQTTNLSPREAWVNTPYPMVQENITVLDAAQWIQDVTFPARLYLKTLGVENLRAEDIPALNEPLVLDGLAKYQIQHFLQKQNAVHADHADCESNLMADIGLLQDQLPIGKVQYSAWQMSLVEQERLKERLHLYAAEVTATTQRQWRLENNVVMNITVPKQHAGHWISLDAASARGTRRTKVWLEYLLWLSYLNLAGEQAQGLQRIAIFSDATIVNTGLTSAQAKAHLLAWFKAYVYGQAEPLVLPAELLMTKKANSQDLLVMNAEKEVEWTQNEAGQWVLNSIDAVLKEWNKSDAFLTYSLDRTESSKKHRDWQFILQEQDATALLQHACDLFAYDLYQPIYQHQKVAEE
ncbi:MULTISPECIES: exodeoxyribonuclease V subunit gamma [Acinetobacter]|uniref:RecBCD enzyme subunit RecC n=1 Tax=Acinetobacter piscicola TaxID=2006115 RepID=A0A7S6VTT6_9GAMM|nr:MULTISPECIES: exodeoxyribonuclease V subunit gamma [Acinetobacter]QOW44798.1 exodeoxyribonuclease V subunit gamma [Acinetobacter piscicola]